ncbi:hypothetical protein ACE11G_04540 [Gordonia sp. PS3]|uniref:hypothetical protein n=1 Tax=Gordonia sp. PS3 TaxID=3248841 RepID=UPI0035BF253B
MSTEERTADTAAHTTVAEAAAAPEPSAIVKLARRMRHVYHTRIRTTTVVLILVWFALLGFYGFSSEHYATEPRVPQGTQVQQPVEPTTSQPSYTSQTPTSSTVESSTEPTQTETPTTETGRGIEGTGRQTGRATPSTPAGEQQQQQLPQAPNGTVQPTSQPGASAGE